MSSNLAYELVDQWRTVAVVFIFLDVFFVCLRFVARRHVKNVKWGWDDGLIVLALVPNLLICAFDIRNVEVNYGLMSTNDPTLVTEYVQQSRKLGYGTDVAYPLAFSLPKLSILCLYLRVFNERGLRKAIYCVMAFVVADCLAFTLATILECIPTSVLWDPRYLDTNPPPGCFDVEAFQKAINPPNIVSDLLILMLPMPSVWSLRISVAKRLGLAATFATGCIGMFASAVRLAAYFESKVYVNNQWLGTIWDDMTIIEPSIYLIAACLPSLQVFITTGGTKNLFRKPFRFIHSPADSGKARPNQASNDSRRNVEQRQRRQVADVEHDDLGYSRLASAGGSTNALEDVEQGWTD